MGDEKLCITFFSALSYHHKLVYKRSVFTGKLVTLSSQYPCSLGYCFEGSKAVDGIYAPTDGAHEFTSIAHTLSTTDAWLQIDLEEPHCVFAVKVWNRGAGLGELQNSV